MTAEGSESAAEDALGQMLQLKAVYGLTTGITQLCFKHCVPQINRKLEDDQKYCIANCAVNYLTTKMLITRKILEQQTSSDLPTQ